MRYIATLMCISILLMTKTSFAAFTCSGDTTVYQDQASCNAGCNVKINCTSGFYTINGPNTITKNYFNKIVTSSDGLDFQYIDAATVNITTNVSAIPSGVSVGKLTYSVSTGSIAFDTTNPDNWMNFLPLAGARVVGNRIIFLGTDSSTNTLVDWVNGVSFQAGKGSVYLTDDLDNQVTTFTKIDQYNGKYILISNIALDSARQVIQMYGKNGKGDEVLIGKIHIQPSGAPVCPITVDTTGAPATYSCDATPQCSVPGVCSQIAGLAPSASITCGGDINQDGQIDQNEYTQCNPGLKGVSNQIGGFTGMETCPMQLQDCNISCPTGYNATNTYSYNVSKDYCDMTPLCDIGGTYNFIAGYNCQNGGSYNPASNQCEASPTTTPVITSYPATTVYSCGGIDILSGSNCINTTTYNAIVGACNAADTLSGTTCTNSVPMTSIYPSPLICVPGDTMTWSGACMNITGWGVNTYPPYSSEKCNPGDTLLPGNTDCSHSYIQTTTYPAPLSCNTGDSLASTLCSHTVMSAARADSSCPTGGTLNGSNCQTTSTGAQTCNPGMSLSGNLCIGPGTAIMQSSSGVCNYDTTRDRCEISPVCPSGTTLNNTRDRCEAPFACAAGVIHTNPASCDVTALSLNQRQNICMQNITGSTVFTNNTIYTLNVWYNSTPASSTDQMKVNSVTPSGTLANQLGVTITGTNGGALAQTILQLAGVDFQVISATDVTNLNSHALCWFSNFGHLPPAGSLCQNDSPAVLGINTSYTTTIQITAGVSDCSVAPSCPTGTTLDAANNVCFVALFCPFNTIYDPAVDMCQKPVICPNGQLDPVTDKCIAARNLGCPIGVSPIPATQADTYFDATTTTLTYVSIQATSNYAPTVTTNTVEGIIRTTTYSAAATNTSYPLPMIPNTYPATSATCQAGDTLITPNTCEHIITYPARTSCNPGDIAIGSGMCEHNYQEQYWYEAYPQTDPSCDAGDVLNGSTCTHDNIVYDSYPAGCDASGCTCSVTWLHDTLNGTMCDIWYSTGTTTYPATPGSPGGCLEGGNIWYGNVCMYYYDTSFSYTFTPCDSGDTQLDGTTCQRPAITYTATPGTCNSGDSLTSFFVCTHYTPGTCNFGDTLQSTTCTHTVYSCNQGDSLLGNICTHSELDCNAVGGFPNGTGQCTVTTKTCTTGDFMVKDATGSDICQHKTYSCNTGDSALLSAAQNATISAGTMCEHKTYSCTGIYQGVVEPNPPYAAWVQANDPTVAAPPEFHCHYQGYTCPATGYVLSGNMCNPDGTTSSHGCFDTSKNYPPTTPPPGCLTGDISIDSTACATATPGNNHWQCSPYDCTDLTNPANTTTNNPGETGVANDGATDPDTGQCMDQVQMFSGTNRSCKRAGVMTGGMNCCDPSIAPADTAQNSTISSFGGAAAASLMLLASTGIGAAVAVASMVASMLLKCSSTDLKTVKDMNKGACHYIDTYCRTKWAIVGCVQRAKGFCCFDSMLARIVQEQGRPMISTFNPGAIQLTDPVKSEGHYIGTDSNIGAQGWVKADGANCRGFTVDEFTLVDFGNIDLSEWGDKMTTKLQSTVQTNTATMRSDVQSRVQNSLSGIRPGGQ